MCEFWDMCVLLELVLEWYDAHFDSTVLAFPASVLLSAMGEASPRPQWAHLLCDKFLNRWPVF